MKSEKRYVLEEWLEREPPKHGMMKSAPYLANLMFSLPKADA